jgi:hypothetical protein
MGFFRRLLGDKSGGGLANCVTLPDRVWKTTDAKFAGLAKEAAGRAPPETFAVLLVAHFPDVLAELERIAEEGGAVPVLAVLARDLSPQMVAGLDLDATATIDIVLGERHPVRSYDDRLVDFAAACPCRCRLSHHLSLDDALMEAFGGDWLKEVLERLGMTDDEAIESSVVARRIEAAQRQLGDARMSDAEAGSAAEWMEKNRP